MVEFTDLWVENFMPFGERQHIRLKDQGIVRVEGRNLDEGDSNRAGKSAIIEAILWCLFGRTIRGTKHDKVVNRFSKKDCRVRVQFRIGIEVYRAGRYRKHRKYGNRLRLWAGGKPIGFRHEGDAQFRLEQIIGCGFESFSNSVVFGGVRPFPSLTDAEQRKVLEAFLHFDKFEEAQKRTKDRISKAQDVLQDCKTSLAGCTERVSSLREQRRVIQRSEKAFIERLEKDLADVEGKIIRLGPPAKLEDKEAAETKVAKRQDRLAASEERLRSLKRDLKDVREAMENRSKLLGRPCPTCGQDISKDTVGPYLEHLASEKRSIKKKICSVGENKANLERGYSHARKVLKRVTSAYFQHREELKQLGERAALCRESLVLARSSDSPLERDLYRVYRKYSKALARQLRLERKMKATEKKIEALKFWEYGFSNKGIRAAIIKDALPALNAKLAEYASIIFEGKAKLEFVPTKETKDGTSREIFHVAYTARHGGDSYESESSGGRRRIDICVLLCFAWLSHISNLLLVDELLDGLDANGREAVLSILSGLRGTVLVISHRWDIKSSIGKTWVVTKKNGYSTVEAA